MTRETDELHSKREQSKLREVERDLKKQGYEVVREPSSEALPEFLRSLKYRPDLLARSKNENLIVEVMSRPSIRGNLLISEVADLVNQESAWRFLFIYSNPKQSAVEGTSKNVFASEHLRNQLDDANSRIKTLKDTTERKAFFLLFWSLAEASLREAMRDELKSKSLKSSYTLLRDARIDGLLSEAQFKKFRELHNKRNAISHGVYESTVSAKDLQKLVQLAEIVLTEQNN